MDEIGRLGGDGRVGVLVDCGPDKGHDHSGRVEHLSQGDRGVPGEDGRDNGRAGGGSV